MTNTEKPQKYSWALKDMHKVGCPLSVCSNTGATIQLFDKLYPTDTLENQTKF